MTSRRTSFNLRFAAIGILLFVGVVLFNAVVARVNLGRFDFTEDKVYTISPAAKRILAELEVPVQVKLYITAKDKMPSGLNNLERDLTDKLNEFSLASSGNLSFALYDPSADDELAEKLAPKGIRPFQVQSIEKDAMGVKLVYSSMAIAYLDKDEEIIPQVLPQSLATLEYDVCSAISRLVRDNDPVVAVYASKQTVDPQLMQMYMQMGQQPPPPQDIYGQSAEMLRNQKYDVRPIDISETSPIPEDASTLVLLAPKNLNERQVYEINKFAQTGGSVIIAAQSYEYSYSPGRRGGFSISATRQYSGMESLLKGWGVSVSEMMTMDANSEVLAIPSTRDLGGIRVQVNEPVQAPMQIKVSTGQFNEDLSISSSLNQLLYLWGSHLELDTSALGESNVEVSTLITTSADAWNVEYKAGPLDNRDFSPEGHDPLKEAPLAVLLEGDLPNSLTTGNIPAWSAADTLTTGAMENFEAMDSHVLIIGCSKMFDDGALASPGNALFLLNAVDALTLGDDLIEIRSKVTNVRALEPSSDEAKLIYRFFVVGLIPILIAIFGIGRLVNRRREEAAFLAAAGR